jgi:hypothetical protein
MIDEYSLIHGSLNSHHHIHESHKTWSLMPMALHLMAKSLKQHPLVLSTVRLLHIGQELTVKLNASWKVLRKHFELPQLKVGTGNKPCIPSFLSIMLHHIEPSR